MKTATLAACLALMWLTVTVAACSGGTTKPESCTDGEKDQNETDVDCGGVCAPCANGLHCLVDADCANGECSNGICVIPGEECDIGDTRCNSSGNVETCADPGDHWDEKVCANGCRVVSGQAECIEEPACTEGQTRCTDGDLETCDAGGEWQRIDCEYGCVTTGGISRCADEPSDSLPDHFKSTAGSGRASSTSYNIALRLGAPVPAGRATASGKELAGSGAALP